MSQKEKCCHQCRISNPPCSETCYCHSQKESEWVERFNEEFGYSLEYASVLDMKAFISEAISLALQKDRERISSAISRLPDDDDSALFGNEEAIQELDSIINPKT